MLFSTGYGATALIPACDVVRLDQDVDEPEKSVGEFRELQKVFAASKGIPPVEGNDVGEGGTCPSRGPNTERGVVGCDMTVVAMLPFVWSAPRGGTGTAAFVDTGLFLRCEPMCGRPVPAKAGLKKWSPKKSSSPSCVTRI